jgi:hypothetical protein
MVETRAADASTTRLEIVATLIGVAAIVGITYAGDRVYHRWLEENHPLAEHRARIDRLKAGFRRKRANVAEVAQIVSDVLVEVARATSTGSA